MPWGRLRRTVSRHRWPARKPGACPAASSADQIGWAAAVRCPVYVVHGTADPRPAANALQLADRLARPRKRVVTEAGHLPWIEQPEQLRELLAEIVQAGRC